ncbi:MAG: dethiobiotin synthase [Flavobacteriales bacterium]|nr:dethiobiotin synthase [Flavobacteriales bacterium]
MKRFFVTGIGTNVGKTVVAAILTEALEADYWKPIQAGDLDNSDSIEIKRLISNKKTKIYPETYRLSNPLSPHAAAKYDSIEIDINKITIPITDNHLIIEGAGGLMVPLNEEKLMIDLIQQLKVEVILVSKHYLGSINHTLLSIEILKSRNIPIRGIIFNGNENQDTEQIILKYSSIQFLGRINPHTQIDRKEILNYKNTFVFED